MYTEKGKGLDLKTEPSYRKLCGVFLGKKGKGRMAFTSLPINNNINFIILNKYIITSIYMGN